MARIVRPLDCFGLNHYSLHYIKAGSNLLGATFGQSCRRLSRELAGHSWPLRIAYYVLENGTAQTKKPDNSGRIEDAGRIGYLQAYTDTMQEAISAGANVRGHFVWSLLDNFEWGSGHTRRFGLGSVD